MIDSDSTALSLVLVRSVRMRCQRYYLRPRVEKQGELVCWTVDSNLGSVPFGLKFPANPIDRGSRAHKIVSNHGWINVASRTVAVDDPEAKAFRRSSPFDACPLCSASPPFSGLDFLVPLYYETGDAKKSSCSSCGSHVAFARLFYFLALSFSRCLFSRSLRHD